MFQQEVGWQGQPPSYWLRLFSSQTFSRINTPTFSNLFILHTYPPMKMEQTECSETSAYKFQTPGNYPEESMQHSEHGESLKSRMNSAVTYRNANFGAEARHIQSYKQGTKHGVVTKYRTVTWSTIEIQNTAQLHDAQYKYQIPHSYMTHNINTKYRTVTWSTI